MGQALEVDRKVGVTLLERTGKWGNKLSKTEKQKKISFGSQYTLLSPALLIIVDFHAINSAFSYFCQIKVGAKR
jgi:hypothetical protein